MINLMHGDCLEMMKQIPDGSVDMVLTDPPYGTTACSWDAVIPLEPMWEQVRRVLTPTGNVVFTAAQPFSSVLVSGAFDIFKHASVWVKNRPTGPQHAKNRPMSKHEDVLVFSKGKMGHAIQLGNSRMTYNPIGVSSAGLKTVTAKGSHSSITGPRPNQVGRVYEAQTGFPHTVLFFDKEESHYHPTQKPVALMEYLIKTYTNEGETVLDFTMGSGTTGVAAKNLNRSFIGIELDETYFNIAKERIENSNPLGKFMQDEEKKD
jgi:site-specific DNA-methyltransferase (adenine-specific)